MFEYEDRSQAGRKVKDKLSSGTNQWALKSVIYADSTPPLADNPRTDYNYLDNAYRPYLITKATNRAGTLKPTWTEWTYDVKKRVTSARAVRSSGTVQWKYAYDDVKQQVTVTEPAGWQVLYDRKRADDGLATLDPVGGVDALGASSGPPAKIASSVIVAPPFIIPVCWFGFSCPQFDSAPAMCSTGYPPGFWPGDRGAKEWGRRNGVGEREGGRRFHDIKKGDTGSKPTDSYGVNPGTGDVVDPNGEWVGNLGDK